MAGKYGAPKYGDDDEFPLTPGERELLKRKFSVNIVYPELAFFWSGIRVFIKRAFTSVYERTG